MSSGPSTSDAPDDFLSDWSRRRGYFRGEGGVSSCLWLEGATLGQLRSWVEEAYPGPLARVQSEDVGDAGITTRQVEGLVFDEVTRLRVLCNEHDGGFLHAVAVKAAAGGVPALVADDGSFYGPTGFHAMTEYLPGAAPRTEWLDPLRGLSPEPGRVRAWLSRYVGVEQDFLEWVLDPERGSYTYASSLTQFVGFDKGDLLKAVRWSRETAPAPAPIPPLPPSTVPPWQAAAEPAPEPAGGVGSSVVAGTVMSLASVSVCVLGASLGGPRTLLEALMVSGTCVVLLGWLALVPLKGPRGRLIDWRWRLGWFGGLPAVVPLVTFLAGGAR